MGRDKHEEVKLVHEVKQEVGSTNVNKATRHKAKYCQQMSNLSARQFAHLYFSTLTL